MHISLWYLIKECHFSFLGPTSLDILCWVFASLKCVQIFNCYHFKRPHFCTILLFVSISTYTLIVFLLPTTSTIVIIKLSLTFISCFNPFDLWVIKYVTKWSEHSLTKLRLLKPSFNLFSTFKSLFLSLSLSYGEYEHNFCINFCHVHISMFLILLKNLSKHYNYPIP